MSKYGIQPGKKLLHDAGHSMQYVANELGMSHGQVRCPLEGKCRPRPALMAFLMELLDVEAEDLFTEEVLSFPHNPRMNPWKPVKA